MISTFAPLKTLTSASHTVALYPDRLVIERADWLAKLFGSQQVVYLNDIHEIRLYASRFMPTRCLQLAVIDKHGQTIGLTFPVKHQREARELKEAVEDLLSHRELSPLPVT
jgi:hypothetical protein